MKNPLPDVPNLAAEYSMIAVATIAKPVKADDKRNSSPSRRQGLPRNSRTKPSAMQ